MRWAVLLLLVLGTPSATAQERVKWVTFYTDPPEARVVLQLSGTAPYTLGSSNRPVALDLSLFDGRSDVSVTFEKDGWHPDTRVLQQAPARSRYFETRDRYPESGAVRLSPRADLAGRWARWKQAAPGYWPAVPALLLLAWLVRRRLRRVPPAFGEYRLLEPLGSGGMATVYRARRMDALDPSEQVAVKVLHPQLCLSLDYTKRFRREVQICLRLDHPNVVRLIDWGEFEGSLYLVMELLEGETLRARLSRGQPTLEEV
ncbi:MAG: protein kinase, partial [Candidatus Eremiobacterota bacterium]